jgi:hypothetical protein
MLSSLPGSTRQSIPFRLQQGSIVTEWMLELCPAMPSGEAGSSPGMTT